MTRHFVVTTVDDNIGTQVVQSFHDKDMALAMFQLEVRAHKECDCWAHTCFVPHLWELDFDCISESKPTLVSYSSETFEPALSFPTELRTAVVVEGFPIQQCKSWNEE